MKRPHFSGALLAAAFFILYAATAQRGVAWQDSGVLQLRVVYRDLLGIGGLACAHPLYVASTHFLAGLAARTLGIETPSAANLASAFWMALALGLFHGCARRLSGSVRAAVLATLTLGLAHLPWWLATISESYTMSLALIAAETACVIRIIQGEGSFRLYVGAALAAGAGFAVHNLSLLSLPVLAATLAAIGICDVRRTCRTNRNPREGSAIDFLILCIVGLNFLLCAVAFLAVWIFGARTIIEPACLAHAAGAPLPAVLSDVLFGAYGPEVVGRSRLPLSFAFVNLGIVALSLSSPCWAVGAATFFRRIRAAGGLRAAWRAVPPATRYVMALFAVHALFAVRYRVADQALFFLPTLFFGALLLATLLSGCRAPRLLAATTIAAAIAVPIAANAVLHAPPVARRVLAARARLLPFRDELRYWALPWKHNEDSAERFAEEAANRMDAIGGFLYADSTAAPPLMLRMAGHGDNWRLLTPWNDNSGFAAAAHAGQIVFAVSPVRGYCPDDALATGNVKPLFTADPAAGNQGLGKAP